MVLRIDCVQGDDSVVFVLSGRIDRRHVGQLEAQFAAQQRITVDLKDVRLVDRDVVDTLARWSANGIKLENCPAYVREWIAKTRVWNDSA